MENVGQVMGHPGSDYKQIEGNVEGSAKKEEEPIGISWYLLVLVGISWYLFVFVCICLYLLVLVGISWNLLVLVGISWY